MKSLTILALIALLAGCGYTKTEAYKSASKRSFVTGGIEKIKDGDVTCYENMDGRLSCVRDCK